MSKNRSRLDIVRDMLSVAVVKARKTKIMYQANLNFMQVNSYLKGLLDGGLLQLNGDSYYLITQKGHQFIILYDDYLERCNRIREEARDTAKGRQMLEHMCFNDNCDTKQTATKKDVLADYQT